ncbi:hypothetical protein SUGI_0437360 [Cryptomeria japonica]|nr:hypothetical protein SUGI_0437360 [Cryptomeria japonica]
MYLQWEHRLVFRLWSGPSNDCSSLPEISLTFWDPALLGILPASLPQLFLTIWGPELLGILHYSQSLTLWLSSMESIIGLLYVSFSVTADIYGGNVL